MVQFQNKKKTSQALILATQKNTSQQGHSRIVGFPFVLSSSGVAFALLCFFSLQTISYQIKNTETAQGKQQKIQLGALRCKFSSQLSSFPLEIFKNGNIYIAVPPQGVIGGREVGNQYLLCAQSVAGNVFK